MRSVIEWLDDPDAFSLPEDPVAMMALADYLGIDELVERGAERICERVRERQCITTSIEQLIESMTAPVRSRLLDYADATSFQMLQEVIRTFNHQYQRQLEKMLPNSHFARSHDVHTAGEAYDAILDVRRNIAAEIRDGCYKHGSLLKFVQTCLSTTPLTSIVDSI